MKGVLDVLYGPLKRTVTALLQSYLAYYLKDIQLEGLGFLGSELVLHNVDLKEDAFNVSRMMLSRRC